MNLKQFLLKTAEQRISLLEIAALFFWWGTVLVSIAGFNQSLWLRFCPIVQKYNYLMWIRLCPIAS
ncbi:hypothetical protein NSS98_25655 [Paenibacillus sp. FSL E2-0274]|uniref:hypothetical protein n=1 Tax=Paenibacillus TaxID=44249 RepID=UPI0011325DCE|nr:hypothetical protein [Paenibacillus odorifer]